MSQEGIQVVWSVTWTKPLMMVVYRQGDGVCNLNRTSHDGSVQRRSETVLIIHN